MSNEFDEYVCNEYEQEDGMNCESASQKSVAKNAHQARTTIEYSPCETKDDQRKQKGKLNFCIERMRNGVRCKNEFSYCK